MVQQGYGRGRTWPKARLCSLPRTVYCNGTRQVCTVCYIRPQSATEIRRKVIYEFIFTFYNLQDLGSILVVCGFSSFPNPHQNNAINNPGYIGSTPNQ